jgi:twinkle protein
MDADFGVTSVNMGAPNENDGDDSKKLECIMNCIELFEEAENVYLSVDNDPNGRRLEEFVTRKVEKHKILFVKNDPQKDGNQVLTECGIMELMERLNSAKRWSPPGIYRAGDIRDRILDAYRNGFAMGETTHFPSIDRLYRTRRGDLVVLTGYNNDGKSIVLNQIQLLKSVYDGWEHAVFSPENMPIEKFYLNLSHQYIGKPFRDGPSTRMNEDELNAAISFLHEHMHVVNPPRDYKWTTLLESFQYLCRVRNISTILIDPFNQVEHYRKPGQTMDEYVSMFMSDLKRLAVEQNVVVYLIAHQNKPDKLTPDGNYPKPNKYNIKNGGTFSDKADVVLGLWRPVSLTDPKDPRVVFMTMKVKDAGLHGEWGEDTILFDRVSSRYLDQSLGNKSPFDVALTDPSTGRIEHVQRSILFPDPNRTIESTAMEDAVPF